MQAALLHQGLTSSTLSFAGSLSVTCVVVLALFSDRPARVQTCFATASEPVNSLFLAISLNAAQHAGHLATVELVSGLSSSSRPLNGMANGAFFTTMPTVVSSTVDSDRTSLTMAMAVTGWSGGFLMGAPIAGYLLQAFSDEQTLLDLYRPAIFYAGGVALASAVCVVVARMQLAEKVIKKA